jgi:hypothetical protein
MISATPLPSGLFKQGLISIRSKIGPVENDLHGVALCAPSAGEFARGAEVLDRLRRETSTNLAQERAASSGGTAFVRTLRTLLRLKYSSSFSYWRGLGYGGVGLFQPSYAELGTLGPKLLDTQ